MGRKLIMVSGKNGQLGNELQDISKKYTQFDFCFFGKDLLDITRVDMLEQAFEKYKPHYFINAAAYTAADKSESDKEATFSANAAGVNNIAKACSRYDTKLITISSDYVFGGEKNIPYKEDDPTDPVNYYGVSKVAGEEMALAANPQTIILRISWVYSHYGNNFVKTMLRLMNERPLISIVNDRIGSPTYAKDVAELILQIIDNDYSAKIPFSPGIYHFSNEGIISWFDFANAIKEIKNLNCKVTPISSEQYIAPAKRPAYSVLNKDKLKAVYNIQYKDWKDSLKECLDLL